MTQKQDYQRLGIMFPSVKLHVVLCRFSDNNNNTLVETIDMENTLTSFILGVICAMKVYKI